MSNAVCHQNALNTGTWIKLVCSLHIQKCESKVVDPCTENQNTALAPKATFHSAHTQKTEK